MPDPVVDSVSAWTKRCYLAARAAMENALRPYELGATQWYVLHRLADAGPTRQRELQRVLQVERATLSVVVGALVRKEFVEQVPDPVDQRQKMLRMTQRGAELWDSLPDLAQIRSVAFGGIDDADLAVTVRVLQMATERLEGAARGGN
jgi:DNA-binding MarR family transcriptional regulator